MIYNQPQKFSNIERAVDYCHNVRPNIVVYIIHSKDDYYVEEETSMVRTWETLLYEGPGKLAQAPA
jgi:hypothetical protein